MTEKFLEYFPLTADKNLSKDVKIALVKMIKLAVKNLTKRKAVKG